MKVNNAVDAGLLHWADAVLDTDPRTEPVFPSRSWKAVRDIARRTALRKWSVFLIGGAIRDFVLSGGTKEPRDVDFVFCEVQLEQIYSEFHDLTPITKTSLGGLRMSLHGTTVDIWPLKDTYAIRSKPEVTIHDVTKHTFLNIEAIAIELSPGSGKRRQIVDTGFSRAIQERTLEINYEPNPVPEVCLIKIISTAIGWEMNLGVSILKYVQQRSWELGKLMKAQESHFGEAKLDGQTVERSLSILHNWDYERGRLNLAKQLSLEPRAKRLCPG